MNEQDKLSVGNNPDRFEAYPEGGAQEATPEQRLFREAANTRLMRDQKRIWEMYNYDRLTTVEIAKKMKVSQQTISKRIKVIENILIDYMEERKRALNFLQG